MAYATASEVYERGNFETVEQDDTKIDNLITAAEKFIDSYTHNTFEVSSDTTRKFDAVEDVDGQTLFFHGKYGLDWLASITTVTNGDGTVISSGSYVTEPRHSGPYYGITLKSSVAWTYNTADSIDAISIEGKWGYSETVPAVVSEACILLVLHWYRMGDQAEEKMIPDDICQLLMPYRKV